MQTQIFWQLNSETIVSMCPSRKHARESLINHFFTPGPSGAHKNKPRLLKQDELTTIQVSVGIEMVCVSNDPLLLECKSVSSQISQRWVPHVNIYTLAVDCVLVVGAVTA